MPAHNDLLTHAFVSSRDMVRWMTQDLNGDDWLHRPCEDANCAVWLVGHLGLVDRRALGLLGQDDLPELPAGFETTYGRADDAPAATSFGDPAEAMRVFEAHRELVLLEVGAIDAGKLAEPLAKPWAINKSLGDGLVFMANHCAMHAGHLSTIRRSLGRPPVV